MKTVTLFGNTLDARVFDHYGFFVERLWSGDFKAARDDDISHAALGLAGESGEVVEVIKKYIRGDGPINLEKLEKELGDQLYYWFALALLCKLDPAKIMQTNHDKLVDRLERGVIKGSGDNR